MVAGPVEATAIGNVLVQARAHGLIAGGARRPARTWSAAVQPRFGATSRRPAGPVGMICRVRVALFITCFNDTLFPDVGQAAVRVLRRLGHEVDFPEAQTCCGQMHFNTGYRAECVPLVRRFADVFAGYDAVVTPSRVVRGDGPPPPRAGRRVAPATRPSLAPSARSSRASTS